MQTVTILVTLCSLLVLSAGYMVQFQNWLLFSSHVQNNQLKQYVDEGVGFIGIRSIVTGEEISSHNNEQETVNRNTSEFFVKNPTINQSVNDKHTIDRLEYIVTAHSQTINTNFDNMNRLADSAFELSEKREKDLPFIVELEEELLIEFSENYSVVDMKKAISRLLVLPSHLNSEEIAASNAVNTYKRPYLYKRVLNEHKKPVRYPAQGYRYAEFLLKNNVRTFEDESGMFTVVTIPLTNYQLPSPVKAYQAWVDSYSERYKVSPDLVFAIMDVESAFNPRAVSSSNALGLMQIKAAAAGRDVYESIDGKKREPSKKELFNPQENIRVGVAYMGMLKHSYLQGVHNAKNKEMLMISSYNGGIASVLKLFGKTPEKAVKRINRLHPKQVYRTLRYTHHSDETKRYIDKVMQAKNRYSKLLDYAA